MRIRRKVFARHDRSPIPGSVSLLAPHYREGMEMVYTDMRKVIRFVQPDPMPAAAIGSSDMAQAGRLLHYTSARPDPPHAD